MIKKLQNLFFFGTVDGSGTGDPGTEPNTDEQDNASVDGGAEDNAGQGDGGQDAGINEDEMQRIATERSARAERSALKSYLKQQGMTEAQAEQAFAAYKQAEEERKAAERNDIDALRNRVDTYEQKGTEALRAANYRLIKASAIVQANQLGVRPDRIDFTIRAADLSEVEVDEDGNVDDAALQQALQAVLDQVPEFKKTSDEDSRTGFKIGSPGTNRDAASNDELAAIFGNK